ncbi:hypothetical protein [Nannocystis pusilla]|uniref:hypothetical protein n=1 Tax=Nannocystis pusilla TaxID=889268 RepID=UPI003B7D29EB
MFIRIRNAWRALLGKPHASTTGLLKSLVEAEFATARDTVNALHDLQRQVQESTRRLIEHEFALQRTLIAGMQTVAASSNPPSNFAGIGDKCPE